MTDNSSHADTAASLDQTVDDAGIAAFHHAFGGSNAIHVDAEAAKALGGLVQHGMRTVFPVFAMLAQPAGSGPLRIAVRFLAPVKAGDRLVTLVQPEGQGAYAVTSANAAGTTVMAGRAEASAAPAER